MSATAQQQQQPNTLIRHPDFTLEKLRERYAAWCGKVIYDPGAKDILPPLHVRSEEVKHIQDEKKHLFAFKGFHSIAGKDFYIDLVTNRLTTVMLRLVNFYPYFDLRVRLPTTLDDDTECSCDDVLFVVNLAYLEADEKYMESKEEREKNPAVKRVSEYCGRLLPEYRLNPFARIFRLYFRDMSVWQKCRELIAKNRIRLGKTRVLTMYHEHDKYSPSVMFLEQTKLQYQHHLEVDARKIVWKSIDAPEAYGGHAHPKSWNEDPDEDDPFFINNDEAPDSFRLPSIEEELDTLGYDDHHTDNDDDEKKEVQSVCMYVYFVFLLYVRAHYSLWPSQREMNVDAGDDFSMHTSHEKEDHDMYDDDDDEGSKKKNKRSRFEDEEERRAKWEKKRELDKKKRAQLQKRRRQTTAVLEGEVRIEDLVPRLDITKNVGLPIYTVAVEDIETCDAKAMDFYIKQNMLPPLPSSNTFGGYNTAFRQALDSRDKFDNLQEMRVNATISPSKEKASAQDSLYDDGIDEKKKKSSDKKRKNDKSFVISDKPTFLDHAKVVAARTQQQFFMKKMEEKKRITEKHIEVRNKLQTCADQQSNVGKSFVQSPLFQDPNCIEDPVIMICTEFWVSGDPDPFLTVIHSLMNAEDNLIDPATGKAIFKDVVRFSWTTCDKESERLMLQHFAHMKRTCFDVMMQGGWNSNRFDFPNYHIRGHVLKVPRLQRYSRFLYWKDYPVSYKKASSVRFLACEGKELYRKADKSEFTFPGIKVSIPGVEQLDFMISTQKSGYKMDSYSLGEVAKKHLKGMTQKKDLPHKLIAAFFTANAFTRSILLEYLWYDVRVTSTAMNQLNLLINVITRSPITKTLMGDLFRGTQIQTWNQLQYALYYNGFVMDEQHRLTIQKKNGVKTARPEQYQEYLIDMNQKMADRERRAAMTQVEKKAEKAQYLGAYVVHPFPGFYEEDAFTQDFSSLYPSIIIAHLLDYATYICHEYTNQGEIWFPQFGDSFATQQRDKYILWTIEKPFPKQSECIGKHVILAVEYWGSTESIRQQAFHLIKSLQAQGRLQPMYTFTPELKEEYKKLFPKDHKFTDFAPIIDQLHRPMEKEPAPFVRPKHRPTYTYCFVVREPAKDAKTCSKNVDAKKHDAETCEECFPKPKTLIVKVLQDALHERSAVKKDLKAAIAQGLGQRAKVLDVNQNCLKLIANSAYGFAGATVGMLGMLAIAACTTLLGQFYANVANIIAEYWYFAKTIYGDTDSIMTTNRSILEYHNGNRVKARIDGLQFALLCGAVITKACPRPMSILPENGAIMMLWAPKMYAKYIFWAEDPKAIGLKTKGLSIVRSDTPFIMQVLHKLGVFTAMALMHKCITNIGKNSATTKTLPHLSKVDMFLRDKYVGSNNMVVQGVTLVSSVQYQDTSKNRWEISALLAEIDKRSAQQSQRITLPMYLNEQEQKHLVSSSISTAAKTPFFIFCGEKEVKRDIQTYQAPWLIVIKEDCRGMWYKTMETSKLPFDVVRLIAEYTKPPQDQLALFENAIAEAQAKDPPPRLCEPDDVLVYNKELLCKQLFAMETNLRQLQPTRDHKGLERKRRFEELTRQRAATVLKWTPSEQMIYSALQKDLLYPLEMIVERWLLNPRVLRYEHVQRTAAKKEVYSNPKLAQVQAIQKSEKKRGVQYDVGQRVPFLFVQPPANLLKVKGYKKRCTEYSKEQMYRFAMEANDARDEGCPIFRWAYLRLMVDKYKAALQFFLDQDFILQRAEQWMREIINEESKSQSITKFFSKSSSSSTSSTSSSMYEFSNLRDSLPQVVDEVSMYEFSNMRDSLPQVPSEFNAMQESLRENADDGSSGEDSDHSDDDVDAD